MPEAIRTEDFEVVRYLTSLDLDKDGLMEIARYAESERALCTGNDAPGFAAMVVYDKLARGLRERYCGKDWEKDESHGQAGIRHRTKNIRIVPCNFDENTCSSLRQPRNNSPKGEVSGRKTRCNATGWLPNLPQVEQTSEGDAKTLLFGVRAVEGESLKAELCVPMKFDGKYFTHLVDRVAILSGNEDDDQPGGTRRDDDRGPTNIVDIAVFRK